MLMAKKHSFCLNRLFLHETVFVVKIQKVVNYLISKYYSAHCRQTAPFRGKKSKTCFSVCCYLFLKICLLSSKVELRTLRRKLQISFLQISLCCLCCFCLLEFLPTSELVSQEKFVAVSFPRT